MCANRLVTFSDRAMRMASADSAGMLLFTAVAAKKKLAALQNSVASRACLRRYGRSRPGGQWSRVVEADHHQLQTSGTFVGYARRVRPAVKG